MILNQLKTPRIMKTSLSKKGNLYQGKKSSVYVKNPAGKVVIVRFGDPDMTIKKSDPGRRKNFRARHNCDTATDKTTPRHWSCKAWILAISLSILTLNSAFYV